MPVTSLTLAALAALFLAPTFAQAQSRVLIKHAHQLADEAAVKKASASYYSLAGAYVLYDQCSKDLNISEAKGTYLKDKFTQVGREYQIAYRDTYVNYVGAPPNKALVDDIAASITQQQQIVVNTMATVIRNKGCHAPRLRKLLKYVDALEAAEKKLPSDNALPAPNAIVTKSP